MKISSNRENDGIGKSLASKATPGLISALESQYPGLTSDQLGIVASDIQLRLEEGIGNGKHLALGTKTPDGFEVEVFVLQKLVDDVLRKRLR
jgi:hypothetical protein